MRHSTASPPAIVRRAAGRRPLFAVLTLFARRIRLVLLLAATATAAAAAAAEFPEALPYSDYAERINLSDYRARPVSAGGGSLRLYWDGSTFIDAGGSRYTAPEWFSAGFPPLAMDGSLTAATLDDNAVGRILRASAAVDGWRKLSFIALDLPEESGGFDERQAQLTRLLEDSNLPNLRGSEWNTFLNRAALQQALDTMYKNGGDGYLLYKRDSDYAAAAGELLLALPYSLGEATVLAQRRGAGQFAGMMGSLEVSDDAGGRFIIATGYTRAVRQKPPAIGSRIIYKYKGYTATGKPKNPVFRAVRPAAAGSRIAGAGGLTTTHLMWFFITLMGILTVLDAATHTRGGRRWNFKSAIVSTGLLGTFVGVFLGLYHFDTGDIAAGVPALLEGLKLSFITSIVGITLSTLLSVVQTVLGTAD